MRLYLEGFMVVKKTVFLVILYGLVVMLCKLSEKNS